MRIFWLFLAILLLQPQALFALTLDGTGDSELLMRRLAVEFNATHPENLILVPRSIGSTGGIRLLLQGRTDLARVARPLTAREDQHEIHWREFARVPIVFVANLPAPCLSDLTTSQILDVFSGRITLWSQLGNCAAHKIYLARREKGDSSDRVLRTEIANFRHITDPVGQIIYTTPDTLAVVAEHPYTLAYLPLTEAGNSPLTRFSLNGIIADNKNVSTGRYPLILPLAVAWRGPLRAKKREFLDFLFSPAARKLIRTFGATPSSSRKF